MSHMWQYNRHPMNYGVTYNFPQSLHADIPRPRPRTLEELQVERSYLLNSLQREDFKATELLKKIRSLQESCGTIMKGPLHTRLKKQLGHFKSRMCQCTKQEKAILTRLGQVAYEIQSKERWSRIECERLQQWNYHGFDQMTLGAPYPEFTSQPMYGQHWPIQPIPNSSLYEANASPVPMYKVTPECYAPTARYDSNEVYEEPRVTSIQISNRVRSVSMVNLDIPVEKVKRLSMPEMSTGDSMGVSSSNYDGGYIGYRTIKPTH